MYHHTDLDLGVAGVELYGARCIFRVHKEPDEAISLGGHGRPSYQPNGYTYTAELIFLEIGDTDGFMTRRALVGASSAVFVSSIEAAMAERLAEGSEGENPCELSKTDWAFLRRSGDHPK